MKHYLRIFAALAGLVSSSAFATEPTRPNIIVVFIDDMGWGDFSCFGNKDAKTPHIDRLAREGLAFEDFYVNSPICSDSSRSAGRSPRICRTASTTSSAAWPSGSIRRRPSWPAS